MNTHDENLDDLSHDLRITKIEHRASCGGSWVNGTIAGHRFNALVFAEHAEGEGCELADSRISKLWIQRLADRATTFNWDRGLDQAAADEITQGIVDFLTAGLADHVYAE